ncbi:sugar-binding protein [Cellulomonas sp. KRMCY2]|uniref:substrate-binding domain-containing protein n=1 Tax=Cellulomonas sp. KRMCY2 TaxID=1304865 RepID=UPI00045EC27F|nr:sugar-binding protein [Cellulomonas sp. KRMCY2]
MRRFITRSVALAAVAALSLTACSTRDGAEEPAAEDTGAAAETEVAAGFAADSLIGVALPSKTSENWVLAGDLFTNGLADAGFEADVQYAGASAPVADQQSQIQAMITKGAKVIIIGAADGGQLSTQVEAAREAGAIVIAYDRLILNTEAVDYYVAYDNFNVGELQGQALLDGMAAKGEGPYTIELFSGSSDDANSAVFFDGAMSVLQPAIDAGEVVVGSGQVEIMQTATAGWKAENAQSRMDSLITSTYSGDVELDGVLSPNDTLARAIITSVQGAGKTLPIVTGQDSEVESVKSIMAGEQYSTINKDTRTLVAAAIQMAVDLSKGVEPQVNDTESYDNGVKVVPAYLLPPQIVTKENAATSYENDPTLFPLTQE